MKKSMIAIDGSCLIAVQLNEPLSEKLENYLINEWIPYCTEIAVLETFYIICRKKGWELAEEKIKALKESNVIQIESIKDLITSAAKIKCQNPISIADCLTIALAKKIGGRALFLKKEKEFEKVLENKSFETELTFFNELI